MQSVCEPEEPISGAVGSSARPTDSAESFPSVRNLIKKFDSLGGSANSQLQRRLVQRSTDETADAAGANQQPNDPALLSIGDQPKADSSDSFFLSETNAVEDLATPCGTVQPESAVREAANEAPMAFPTPDKLSEHSKNIKSISPDKKNDDEEMKSVLYDIKLEPQQQLELLQAEAEVEHALPPLIPDESVNDKIGASSVEDEGQEEKSNSELKSNPADAASCSFSEPLASIEETVEVVETGEQPADLSQVSTLELLTAVLGKGSLDALDEPERPSKGTNNLCAGSQKLRKKQKSNQQKQGEYSAADHKHQCVSRTDLLAALGSKKRKPALLSTCARTLKNKDHSIKIVRDASRSMLSLVARADEPILANAADTKQQLLPAISPDASASAEEEPQTETAVITAPDAVEFTGSQSPIGNQEDKPAADDVFQDLPDTPPSNSAEAPALKSLPSLPPTPASLASPVQLASGEAASDANMNDFSDFAAQQLSLN